MTVRITRHAFLTAASLAVLGACDRPEPQATPSPSSEPVEGPEPEDTSQAPITDAAASDADREAAVATALATMNVWVQGSTLDEQTWRQQINATMTASGQQALQSVWGYRVQDTTVVGEPSIQREDLGTIVVRVATDYTSYDVTVVNDNDRWLTADIRTADGQPL